MAQITINGQKYELLYNGAAMFALHDICGETSLTDAIRAEGAEAFEVIARIGAELAKQGELLRRFMGEDKRPILTAEEILATTTPIGAMHLRTAIMAAITEGYKRSTAQENGDIDLGLLELNKKKNKPALMQAQYLYLAKAAGLSVKEAMMLRVGLVFDMIELKIPREIDPDEITG